MTDAERKQIMYTTTSKAKKGLVPSMGHISVMDMHNSTNGIYQRQEGLAEEMPVKQLAIQDGLTPLDIANSFGFHLWEKHKFDENRRKEAIERAAYVANFEDHLNKATTDAEAAAKTKYSKGKGMRYEKEKNKQFVVLFAKSIGFVHESAKYSSSLDDKVQKILSTQRGKTFVQKLKKSGSLASASKVKSLLEPIAVQQAAQQGKPSAAARMKELYGKHHESVSDALDVGTDLVGVLGDSVGSDVLGHAGNVFSVVHGIKKTCHAFKDAADLTKKGDKARAAITKVDAVLGNITDVLGCFEEAVPGLAMISGALSSFAAILKLKHEIGNKKAIKNYIAQVESGEKKFATPEEKSSVAIRLSMMNDASNKQIVSNSFDLLDAVFKILEGIAALATSASGVPDAQKIAFGAISVGTKIARKIVSFAMQKRSNDRTAQYLKDSQKQLLESEHYKSLSTREKKIAVQRAYDADNNEQLADRVRIIQAVEMYNRAQVTLQKRGAKGPGLSDADKDLIALMGFGTDVQFLQHLTIEDFVQKFNMEDDDYMTRGQTASQRRDEFDQKMIDRAQRKKDKAQAKAAKKAAKK